MEHTGFSPAAGTWRPTQTPRPWRSLLAQAPQRTAAGPGQQLRPRQAALRRLQGRRQGQHVHGLRSATELLEEVKRQLPLLRLGIEGLLCTMKYT